MVRSLDLDPPPPIILLRPVVNIIVGVVLYFTLFEQDTYFLIFILGVVFLDATTNTWKFLRSKDLKCNFIVEDDLLTYTQKRGYETEVSEEIYLKELILKRIFGADNESPYMVILKSTDDSFKLKIEALKGRKNLENLIEFLALQERVDEDGDPIDEWTCKSFDESALPSTPSDEEMELTAGGLIFMAIFSFFWVGFCSLISALFLFGSDENTLYVLLVLSPFNFVSVVIIFHWVKLLLGRNSKGSPLVSDTTEQVDTTIELRAISSGKQDIED